MIRMIYECDGGYVPVKKYDADAGFDLSTPDDILLEAGKITLVETKIRVLIPLGCVGLILPRSGLSSEGVTVATGVIDAGYTGHIKVAMSIIAGTRRFVAGNRIAQLVVLPLARMTPIEGNVSALKTQRGQNGYGSSGL